MEKNEKIKKLLKTDENKSNKNEEKESSLEKTILNQIKRWKKKIYFYKTIFQIYILINIKKKFILKNSIRYS